MSDATGPTRRIGALAPLALRVGWWTLPLTLGATIGDALGDASRPVQIVATVGAWVIWAAGLGATIVRRPASLTVLRCVAPLPVVAAVAAAVASHASAAALAHASVVLAIAFLPEIGGFLVDGISYGDELRMLLRAPLPLLVGVVPLSWAVAVAAGVGGPLLLAARQWVVGGVVTVIGVAAVLIVSRALHQLSRRWVVFVPNGFVLHDRLTTREPFLLRSDALVSLGPAPADERLDAAGTVDVTSSAPGLVIAAELREPVEVVPVRRGVAEAVSATRVLFVPTRPGALMAQARERRVIRVR